VALPHRARTVAAVLGAPRAKRRVRAVHLAAGAVVQRHGEQAGRKVPACAGLSASCAPAASRFIGALGLTRNVSPAPAERRSA